MSTDTEPRPPRELGRWHQERLNEAVGRPVEAAEPAVLGQIQGRLDDLLKGVERPVSVLDAGCGKRLPIPIATERHLSGIDISASQVERNDELDLGLVGDIQTYPFEPASYDVVTCWNVLEHVPDPRRALANLAPALADPGILVIAGPHPHSFQGVVTKLTPFWVHKLAWKRLLGPDRTIDRFPTEMADAALPEQLTDVLGSLDLRVELLLTYEGWEQRSYRSRQDLVGRAFRGAARTAEVASLRAIRADITDFFVIASK